MNFINNVNILPSSFRCDSCQSMIPPVKKDPTPAAGTKEPTVNVPTPAAPTSTGVNYEANGFPTGVYFFIQVKGTINGEKEKGKLKGSDFFFTSSSYCICLN